MEEDEKNADGTDISHAEKIDAKETPSQSALIGEFLANNLLGNVPSHEETGEESSQWQEDLSCGKVEEVEETHAKERDVAIIER